MTVSFSPSSRFLLTSALALCFTAAPLTAQAQAPKDAGKIMTDLVKKPMPAIVAELPKIQIALLLDTSNSMDGLISQAKSQLWMLVNELSEGEKNGQKPEIELALYEYGNSNISVSKGYIRQVLSLTNDLDGVSEALFALTTNGGQEYAGQVIDTALTELEWSENRDDLKLILIAGNEPFTQGPIDYQKSCARAKKGGIIIDTIHCGDEQVGINTKWKDGADCSGGLYMTINQDEKSVHIPSPYDDELISLNKKLNKTYIGYGKEGAEKKMRQESQDENAAKMGSKSIIARAYSKSKTANYKNESWDLVDAYEADQDKILKLDKEDLPEELKDLGEAERGDYIEKIAVDRKAIQAEIKDLSQKQQAFVAEKRKDMAESQTIDQIVVTGARKQAEQNGFVYQKKTN